MKYPHKFIAALLISISFGAQTSVLAGMSLSSWKPLFKGIDHAIGTNSPDGTYPDQNVIHAIRVDLQDPDIQFFTSPRISNYVVNSRETGGYTVSDFLRINHLQLAINANLFDPQEYYLAAGTPMDISGLSICRGDVVSPQQNSSHAAALILSSNNVPEIIYTNWPARSNSGIFTAVSGDYCVLVKGVNVGYAYRNNQDVIHRINPRTAYGLSQDKRFLFLLTIDGRQPGYSEGSLDFETAAWLTRIGAYDGVNMDGGGSTTLVMQTSTGSAVRLNRSSAVADSGNERTVGSHFGIFAKPVPAFINDVTVIPDDTSALVQWTTTEPASGMVQYGIDTSMGNSTPILSDLTTNHSVQLTGLTPNTTYYYQVESSTNDIPMLSSLLTFMTTNYVTTNTLVALTDGWKYSHTDLDGTDWTASGYDDSAWTGPAPALLWADSRGANANIDQLATPLPFNTSTRFPYPSYYFRSTFQVADITSGTTLYVTAFVDDGAVFYLNGVEVYRLRMADAPTPISYTDLSIGYACGGDATCPDDFQLPPEAAQALVIGSNIFSVEVHNYNAKSPDITFGASLLATIPLPKTVPLSISLAADTITVSWTAPGTLQEATSINGIWANVPGSSISSPWKTAVSGQAHYYRLH